MSEGTPAPAAVTPTPQAGAVSELKRKGIKERMERARARGFEEGVAHATGQLEGRIKDAEGKASDFETRYGSERKSHLTYRAQVETLKHASALNALQPDYVWLDIERRLSFSEAGEPVILDANGKPTTKTLEDAVKDHLADPDRVRSSAPAGGAGSRPSQRTAEPPNTRDQGVRVSALAEGLAKGIL